LLGGLVYAAYRNTREEREQADDEPSAGPGDDGGVMALPKPAAARKEGRRS
jgi:hypothetical protein